MTDSVQVPLGDISVCIGMPTKGDIPPETVLSLIKTAETMSRMGILTDYIILIAGSAVVGRDRVMDCFLKGTAKKLFWIDSDMVWEPNDFLRMLALSTKRDIVCCAYPLKREGDTSYVIRHNGHMAADEFGLLPVEGAGLGFTIVDRRVCETLAAKAPTIHDGMNGNDLKGVFRLDVYNGCRRTEDIAFFADAIDAGFEVLLDPSIELGHIGSREWRGKAADVLQ